LAELQDSSAANRARVMQQWATEEWDRLFSDSSPDFDASPHRFRWALCTVWSRSFQMASTGGGGPWRVLAPVADLLNHVPKGRQPGARLEVVGVPEEWGQAAERRRDAEAEEEEAFVLRAARRVLAGEELTLDYGARANSELLTTHGFAVPNNPHEQIPLSLGVSDEDPFEALKARILSAGNLSSPYTLSVDALRTDSDLLVALRVLTAVPAELKEFALAFQGKPLSDASERRWRRTLAVRVEALLAEREQATTEAEDAALIAQGPAGQSKGDWRSWSALVARHSEKRLLVQVLAELRRSRQSSAGGSSTEDAATTEPVHEEL